MSWPVAAEGWAPVPHLLRLLLVPGGAGAELHVKLHPRQSNPQEIVLVISCSSKPWPLKLCLLVQSLIIHLRALRPCTAGKAKHCQDGREMSQAAAELTVPAAASSLLQDHIPQLLQGLCAPLQPGHKPLSFNPSNQNASWLCSNIRSCQKETLWAYRSCVRPAKKNYTDEFGDRLLL